MASSRVSRKMTAAFFDYSVIRMATLIRSAIGAEERDPASISPLDPVRQLIDASLSSPTGTRKRNHLV